jgi:hypothetical protein
VNVALNVESELNAIGVENDTSTPLSLYPTDERFHGPLPVAPSYGVTVSAHPMLGASVSAASAANPQKISLIYIPLSTSRPRGNYSGRATTRVI